MIGNRTRRVFRSLVVAALAATACGAPPEEDGAAGASTAIVEPASLEAVEGLGVRNVASPAPGLITAAQLTEGQLDGLAEMGYTRFISLRVPSEEGAGWEEAHAEGMDVAFDRIPVAGASGLTRENVERLASLLDDATEGGTVVDCASSNRVGALLALKAYWLDGADAEQAMELGRQAGMRGLEADVAELVSQPR